MNVSRETIDKLKSYEALLHKWQKAVNLVSPNTLGESWERHFEDSLQLTDLIPEDTKIIFDLGSGAGFPGMVLAIARPDMSVHMIESDSKKCSFLKTVSRETSMPAIIHNERIETIKTDIIPDLITARALASLDQLLEWCLPWTTVNPALTLVFLKGEKADQEIIEAEKHFAFSYESFPSKTNEKSVILRIKGLQKLDPADTNPA